MVKNLRQSILSGCLLHIMADHSQYGYASIEITFWNTIDEGAVCSMSMLGQSRRCFAIRGPYQLTMSLFDIREI